MYRLRKSVWSRLVLILVVTVAVGLQAKATPAAKAQNNSFHTYLPYMVGGSGPGNPPPTPTPQPGTTPVYHYQILNNYPHDPNAYTEGLFYQGGYLYEATGAEYTSSQVRKEVLTTGQVLQSTSVSRSYYGEGIAPWGSAIYELTWTSHDYFKYDSGTLSQSGPFAYTPQTQGWGLTQDGTRFIMSDGTSTIYFRDPGTFNVTGSINVTDAGSPVTQLNELEYINGQIWANVWLTDKIAVISPQDGHVIVWIDLTGLRALQGSTVMNNPNAVLNGIAWAPDPSAPGGGHVYVTGKMWSHLYEIQVGP